MEERDDVEGFMLERSVSGRAQGKVFHARRLTKRNMLGELNSVAVLKMVV